MSGRSAHRHTTDWTLLVVEVEQFMDDARGAETYLLVHVVVLGTRSMFVCPYV